jgi:hypothetical protein
MFVIPSHVFIPRGLHFWEQWKKTKKTMHLSNAVGFMMGAFFLYVGALLIIIMRLLGMA